jgi:hypothetical protein
MSLYFRNGKTSIKSATSTTTHVLTLWDSVYIAYPGQTVTLPEPSTCIGHTYTIKLGATHTGSADTVIINVASGGTIEGNATHNINTNWGYHKFIAGNNSAGSATWMIIV